MTIPQSEQLDQTWKNTPPADPIGGPRELPPDGDWPCLLEGFDYIVANSDGTTWLKTELRVIAGDSTGHPIELLHALDGPAATQDKIGYLKRHLINCGIDLPESIDGLHDTLVNAVGRDVMVRVYTSKKRDDQGRPYRNALVDRPLATAENGGSNQAPVGVPSSAIPF